MKLTHMKIGHVLTTEQFVACLFRCNNMCRCSDDWHYGVLMSSLVCYSCSSLDSLYSAVSLFLLARYCSLLSLSSFSIAVSRAKYIVSNLHRFILRGMVDCTSLIWNVSKLSRIFLYYDALVWKYPHVYRICLYMNHHWLFRETVVPCMHIDTHGLSRHSTKTSKQSTSMTLSLTKAFLNNTNNYLT